MKKCHIEQQAVHNRELFALSEISSLCSEKLYDLSFTPDMLAAEIASYCSFSNCRILPVEGAVSSDYNRYVYRIEAGQDASLLVIEGPDLLPQDSPYLEALVGIVRQFMANRMLFERVATAKAEWVCTFDAISDPVFITDKRFNVVRANLALFEKLKMAPATVIGQPCYRLLKRIEAPCPDCIKTLAVLENRQVVQENLKTIIGEHLMHSCYPFNPEDRPGWAVHVLKDISELHHARQSLYRADKLSTVGLLVSSIAHELNNPLASVTIAAELCIKEPEEKRAALLEIIVKETGRMQAIVENLLHLVRPRVMEKKVLDLGQIVQHAVQMRYYQLVAAGIEIRYQQPDQPVLVLADENRLIQLIINLLVNTEQAIQIVGRPGRIGIYLETTEGDRDNKAPAHITPVAGKTGFLHGPSVANLPCDWLIARTMPSLKTGMVRVVVCDNGPGVDPELFEKIFEPFYTTKGERGTGLGLSVSYQITREHNGDLYCCPAAGGAVFCLELPLTSKPVAAEERETVGDLLPLHPLKILVLDDEQIIAHLLECLLQRGSHRVSTFNRSRKALEVALDEDFDLYLCDLRMPDISGQEFYRAVMEKRRNAAGRFLFLTGDTISEGAQRFLEGKAHLRKPFSQRRLLEAIQSVVAGADDQW